MSSAPIGVFDSGVGGLTIVREIQRRLPGESVIYIGDTANCPYGNRSTTEIHQLARQMVMRLQRHGVKMVVIACNTISVNCIGELRAEFPNLSMVGTAPAVKLASSVSKSRRIGVLSTIATANSAYQAMLVEQFASDCKVVNIGTNELVPRIERGAWSTELPDVLPDVLAPFREAEVDALVLGCTHYPLLRNEISQILGPGVAVLDSGEAIARQVGRVLESNGLLNTSGEPPTYRYLTTAESPALTNVLERLGIPQTVTL
ncbi:MAG: glutamate racemase [Thermomicrobiales bacterium]|nr:glutamate racemase [Thermomicrobiales bacterium]